MENITRIIELINPHHLWRNKNKSNNIDQAKILFDCE